MDKIIKQFNVIILAGAMTLTFGCGIEDLIDDLRSELNDDEDFAPALLAEKTFHGMKLSGTGEFSSSTASFTLSFTDSTFSKVYEGGSTRTGTYTYSKTGPKSAVIKLYYARVLRFDPATRRWVEVDQQTVTYTLTFTSATQCHYSGVITTGGTGTTTGTLSLQNFSIS